jgi:hypothetical protein
MALADMHRLVWICELVTIWQGKDRYYTKNRTIGVDYLENRSMRVQTACLQSCNR